MKVLWYHTFLSVTNPKNEMYVTNLISSQIVPCEPAICSNTLNLGSAQATHGGEYVVKLSTVDDYEYEHQQRTYIVRVYSRPSLPVIKVRDLFTNEVKPVINLKYNVIYRFTCSSTSFPRPHLKMSWTSQCNNTLRVDDVMNNHKTANGTFETLLYFDSTPLLEGLLTCTVNDMWKSKLYLTVTDFINPVLDTNILQLNLQYWNLTDGSIYSDNITLVVYLQKRVKKF